MPTGKEPPRGGVALLIKKAQRRLIVAGDRGASRDYGVALGKNWARDKTIEGDLATPEGEFYVCAKNPRSKYVRSLALSYPNTEDAARGLEIGLISAAEHGAILAAIRDRSMPPQHTKLGGEIYIHGGNDGRRVAGAADWTRGCIALDDLDMLELYERVPLGTTVLIVP